MKKHGIKRRVLAALMTACMVVGAVPGVSLADVVSGDTTTNQFGLTPNPKKYNFDGSTSTKDDPDIVLDKQARYLGDNTYEITLSAKAKEQVKTKPTHVVFLLDASGSMNYCTEKAAEENYPERKKPVYEKEGHVHYGLYTGPWNDPNWTTVGCTKVDSDPDTNSRWTIARNAIKKMTENLGSDGITYDYVYFSDEAKDSTDVDEPYSDVDKVWGGTHLTNGVNYALEKFNGDQGNPDQILIIIADGETDDKKDVWVQDGWFPWKGHYEKIAYYPKKELENFQSESHKGKVYTVGFTFTNEDFADLANDPSYNFNANDDSSLNIELNKISKNL